VALGIWAARRRKKKRAEAADAEEHAQVMDSLPAAKPSSRLIVTDRGVGHVVYLITGKGVPKVEHDGKRHTLH
jgi:hypothetical protein